MSGLDSHLLLQMACRSERSLIKARAAYKKADETYINTRSEWKRAHEAHYAAEEAVAADPSKENRAALKNAVKLSEALHSLMTTQGREVLRLGDEFSLKCRQHEDFLERKAWRDGAAERRVT